MMVTIGMEMAMARGRFLQQQQQQQQHHHRECVVTPCKAAINRLQRAKENGAGTEIEAWVNVTSTDYNVIPAQSHAQKRRNIW